jgi:hypothetical protein
VAICEKCCGKGYTGLKRHEAIFGPPTDRPCADCGGTGQTKVVVSASPLIIDCSVPPFVPDGWEVRLGDQIASAFRGRLAWDPDRVRLHLADGQQRSSGFIEGLNLFVALTGQPVLTARVLDWQLEDSANRIPEPWKGKRIFYWGTVYRNLRHTPCVRCLRLHVRTWTWSYYDVHNEAWGTDDPAAVLEP